MKIICTLSEAADLIRACHDGACYNCALTNACENQGADDKHPEQLMEICEDVDCEE